MEGLENPGVAVGTHCAFEKWKTLSSIRKRKQKQWHPPVLGISMVLGYKVTKVTISPSAFTSYCVSFCTSPVNSHSGRTGFSHLLSHGVTTNTTPPSAPSQALAFRQRLKSQQKGTWTCQNEAEEGSWGLLLGANRCLHSSSFFLQDHCVAPAFDWHCPGLSLNPISSYFPMWVALSCLGNLSESLWGGLEATVSLVLWLKRHQGAHKSIGYICTSVCTCWDTSTTSLLDLGSGSCSSLRSIRIPDLESPRSGPCLEFF